MSPQPPAIAKKLKAELSSRTTELRQQRMFKDGLFRWVILPTLGLCIFNIAWMIIFVRPKDFVVPLQYSTLQGFDVLGPWYQVLIYGVFSLVVTIGDILLASFCFEKSRIASFFLLLGSFFVNLLTLRIILTIVAQLNI